MHVASWTGKSPDTPDTREDVRNKSGVSAKMSRGCCYEETAVVEFRLKCAGDLTISSTVNVRVLLLNTCKMIDSLSIPELDIYIVFEYSSRIESFVHHLLAA